MSWGLVGRGKLGKASQAFDDMMGVVVLDVETCAYFPLDLVLFVILYKSLSLQETF